MEYFLQELDTLLLMGALVLFSGFFSGAETAIFSLSVDSASSLAKRHPRTGRRVNALLAEPEDVLSSILFGNLLINTMYFSLGAGLARSAYDIAGKTGMVVASIAVLSALILFGEILPKALAVGSPESSSRIAAFPLWLAHSVLRYPAAILGRPALLMVGVAARRASKKHVEAGELRMLIDMAERSGAVKQTEAELIDAVVVFSEMRVREVMTPRVDINFVDVNALGQEVLVNLAKADHQRAPVFDGTHENVIGVISVDDLMANPNGAIEKLMRPVQFVPENAILSQTFQNMSDTNSGIVVVVDEYGGTSGLLSSGDFADAMLRGFVEDSTLDGDAQKAVEQISPNCYSLSGQLSVRDWSELWGQNWDEGAFDTLGGFIISLLGRIPKTGDEVRWGNVEFVATDVVRGRVRRVKMRLLEEVGG